MGENCREKNMIKNQGTYRDAILDLLKDNPLTLQQITSLLSSSEYIIKVICLNLEEDGLLRRTGVGYKLTDLGIKFRRLK